MQEIKIGKKTYARMENMFDIGDERFVVFKQWLLQAFEDIDKPSFLKMHNKVIEHFNGGENYQIIVELDNFKKALELSELNYDAYSYCFALLHIEKGAGELQSDTKSDKQLTKLKDMREAGLKRSEVEEVVENFIKASPRHFQHYLGMLETMKLLSKDQVLKALAD